MLLGIVLVWNDHKEPRDQITDRQTKELNMKRLLGLLLVMGMVGCGGGDTSPKSSQAKSDEPPVQTVDLSRTVERGGLRYEVNSETPFTGVAVDKYENGQKKVEGTWKDGKEEGLMTRWHENGQKEAEGTFKDGKRKGLVTSWYENGQKKHEVTWKDGKKLSGTYWDEEGNEVEIDEWNRF